MIKNFVCTPTEPVVQTKPGKIRGYKLDDTYTFHGIKYANAERFQMPTEVEPWEGIKDAHVYGFVCPLMFPNIYKSDMKDPQRYWAEDENCQYLNVWTKSINSDKKRPVMVWLHGGGFTSGSSIHHISQDGENMAKYGDVVAISLNHRLNVLGYFNLEPYGEQYANSGNAGNADIVAALQWIHDNIEKFGGDPENVTLFGQSGGGMKIWTLMNTPAADGLFHKGIIQSGVAEDMMSLASDPTVMVNAMLNELGLEESEVDQLATIPFRQLADAYMKTAQDVKKQGEYFGGAPMVNNYYLGNPRVVGFSEHAKTIHVMVGSVFAEFHDNLGIDKIVTTDEQLAATMEERFGDHVEELTTLYKKAYPGRDLADVLTMDNTFRLAIKDFVAKKSEFSEAATYSYIFAYEFPYNNGTQAWHCSEIPFAFHTTDKVPVCNVPGETDKLQERVFGAWMSFAETGDPNHDSLIEWPVCKPGVEPTMVFGKADQIFTNHDKELQELYVQLHIPRQHMYDPDVIE